MVQVDPQRALPSLTEITRRAMLSRGGALVAGTGIAVAGVGAAAVYGAASSSGHDYPTFDVRRFGAVGDGKTDDTASLQKAIAAARKRGGIVFFPPGTYLTRRLTMYSRVHLRGSGGDATILRLRPGADSAILESDGFAGLTGKDSSGGITMFSIRDLTLDGNKANNRKGGYGLRVYGYGYELSEVVVFDCRNDGVYSEWGSTGALPAPSHQMESRLTAVRSHDNEGDGIRFSGPHDSMFLNCVSFQNRGAGFRMGGSATGSSMVNCHAWGERQNTAFDLAASGVGCVNCYADLDGGVGVRVSRSDCRWIGGLVLGYNHAPPFEEIGVQFASGAGAAEPAGVVIDTKIINCATAAVDFGGDKGLSSVRAVVSQPGVVDRLGNRAPGTGLGWRGQPHPSTQVEITGGLGNGAQDLVVRPAFDLRAQAAPSPPDAHAVRVFARTVGGKTQLCAMFPGGAVVPLATEP